jgi:hypothetical protein
MEVHSCWVWLHKHASWLHVRGGLRHHRLSIVLLILVVSLAQIFISSLCTPWWIVSIRSTIAWWVLSRSKYPISCSGLWHHSSASRHLVSFSPLYIRNVSDLIKQFLDLTLSWALITLMAPSWHLWMLLSKAMMWIVVIRWRWRCNEPWVLRSAARASS